MNKSFCLLLFSSVLPLSLFAQTPPFEASTKRVPLSLVCVDKAGAVVVRLKRCKKTETRFSINGLSTLITTTGAQGIAGPQGPKGDQGPQGIQGIQGAPGAKGDSGAPGTPGANGADGALRIFGDGSAGSVAINSSAAFTFSNPQFVDFTVGPSAVLTIPSGTVIRCTGIFKNQGLIIVSPFEAGGSTDSADTTPPAKGISQSAARRGAASNSAVFLAGGDGGLGLENLAQARSVIRLTPAGGGGSAPGADSGYQGGGTLTVIAQGQISNSGGISAEGMDDLRSGINNGAGYGGGGGGVIVLASKASILNTGQIEVTGGNGSDSNAAAGAGGGGGGGIVRFIAPSSLNFGGSIVVSGGKKGSSAINVTITPRRAGSGGGASAGKGGNGDNVSAGGTSSGGSDGSPGYWISTTASPEAFF